MCAFRVIARAAHTATTAMSAIPPCIGNKTLEIVFKTPESTPPASLDRLVVLDAGGGLRDDKSLQGDQSRMPPTRQFRLISPATSGIMSSPCRLSAPYFSPLNLAFTFQIVFSDLGLVQVVAHRSDHANIPVVNMVWCLRSAWALHACTALQIWRMTL